MEKRLTEKVKDTKSYIRLATKDKQAFIDKLGQYEDLGSVEELQNALTELQQIKSAKSTKALECLEDVFDIDFCINEEYTGRSLKEEYTEEYDTIKQALIQAERDKVIADFIRKHYKLSNNINKNYLELKKPITHEEAREFKEVLK